MDKEEHFNNLKEMFVNGKKYYLAEYRHGYTFGYKQDWDDNYGRQLRVLMERLYDYAFTLQAMHTPLVEDELSAVQKFIVFMGGVL